MPLALPQQETRQVIHLPAVLNMRDLTVFFILIVLFVSNTNGVQFGGPAAYVYWALGLITFFIPSAYVTQWLARRFPGQGAPYLWAAHVLGANWSFFAAFCAWMPGVLSVVSAIEASFVFVQYLAPAWFVTPVQQCVGIILVLVVATGITCLPLRWLKYLLLVLVVLYVSVYLLMGMAGGLWLWTGHQAAVALKIPDQWRPSGANFAVYGVVVLALLGVDIPLFMGGEIRGGHAGARRASHYVWWGVAISIVAYVLGTFGVMVVVPAGQAGAIPANVQVIQIVFGSVIGNAIAIVLAGSQVTLTVAYILMFSRLLVIVAQDGRLPASLTKLNRHGVPILSIVTQAAIVACVTVLSFVAVPMLFGTIIRPEDLAFEIYNILLAGAAALWAFSTALLFFFVLSLYYSRKNRALIVKRERPLLLTMSLVGLVASLIGIWATVSSSWISNLIPNGRWAIFVWAVILLSIAIGLIGSEFPRMHALLSEQRRVNDREVTLRNQLQEAYDQQQVLLAEVDRLYREQAQAAVTDAITGLPNHRAVMGRLDEEVSRCQRCQGSCAVLFIDLDHFKRVNDTWGHLAGDAILREVGTRLRSSLRLEDFVGRYGGEEFAIVLADADLNGASETAERLRTIIANEPCSWQADETKAAVLIAVTGSFGVAIYQMHGVKREELIEYADHAMYRAKHSGRNCVCIADPELPSIQESPSFDDERYSQQATEVAPVQTVQALTAAASAHDRGTSAHAQRMMHLAEATAHQLNRSEEELQLVRLAALLHDIGKIGIPDAILHKPGPLTDEEWAVMRRHPEIGHQILKQAGGIFQHLANVVVAHHERWDGQGYPYGLVGEAIPMTACILAVVDSYDAMISRRPYREPLSMDEARAELLRCSGSQYAPSVVDAFFCVLDEQQKHQDVPSATLKESGLAEREHTLSGPNKQQDQELART
jgi:diguanylate cyclase (GGDEF)-like protein/putative nucleotidyltransferase with HDIG domain